MSSPLHPSTILFLLENLDEEKDALILQKLYEIVANTPLQPILPQLNTNAEVEANQVITEMQDQENGNSVQNASQGSVVEDASLPSESSEASNVPIDVSAHQHLLPLTAVPNFPTSSNNNNTSQVTNGSVEPKRRKKGKRQESREEMAEQMSHLMEDSTFVIRQFAKIPPKPKPYDRYTCSFKLHQEEDSNDQ